MARRCRHVSEAEGQAHGFNELGDGLRSTIGQDGDRQVIRNNPFVYEVVCDCWGGGELQRRHLGQLRKAVRNDEYIRRAVFRRSNRTDEVHRDVFQRLSSREKVHWFLSLIPRATCFRTGATVFCSLKEIIRYLRPVVVPSHGVVHL